MAKQRDAQTLALDQLAAAVPAPSPARVALYVAERCRTAASWASRSPGPCSRSPTPNRIDTDFGAENVRSYPNVVLWFAGSSSGRNSSSSTIPLRPCRVAPEPYHRPAPPRGRSSSPRGRSRPCRGSSRVALARADLPDGEHICQSLDAALPPGARVCGRVAGGAHLTVTSMQLVRRGRWRGRDRGAC